MSQSIRIRSLWLLLAAPLALASCRNTPMTPAAALAPPESVEPAAARHPAWGFRTPIIRDMRADIIDGQLVLRARFDPLSKHWRRPYDPEQPGGWVLQLFMNTDQQATGFPWMGVDYLVRGSERLPNDRFVIRRVEPGDEFPGGWGPQSGEAAFRQRPEDFSLTVPLAAIGGDDGVLDFVLETYVTAACEECEGGVTHEWAGDFFGTTDPRRIDTPFAASGGNVVFLTRADAARSGRFGGRVALSGLKGDTAAW